MRQREAVTSRRDERRRERCEKALTAMNIGRVTGHRRASEHEALESRRMFTGGARSVLTFTLAPAAMRAPWPERCCRAIECTVHDSDMRRFSFAEKSNASTGTNGNRASLS